MPRVAHRNGVRERNQLEAMGKDWNTAQASYADSLRQFRKYGLAIYGTFVFGYDEDDWNVVRESVAFAREQKLFLAAFNHLVPFPGTPLYHRLQQQGRLLSDPWWLDPEARVGDVTFSQRKSAPLSWSRPAWGSAEVLQLGLDVGTDLRPACKFIKCGDARRVFGT